MVDAFYLGFFLTFGVPLVLFLFIWFYNVIGHACCVASKAHLPGLAIYASGVDAEQRHALMRLRLNKINAGDIYLQLLRSRTDQEQEPGDSGDGQAAVQQVRLKTLRSVGPQVPLRFCNSTTRVVCLIWMDTSGNECVLCAPKCILQPGAEVRWQSYCTHPWIARDAASGERMMVGERRQAHVVHAGDAGQALHITEPPHMLWTFSTHRHFSACHRSAVRCVLLSHLRLQRPPLPPPPRQLQPAPGDAALDTPSPAAPPPPPPPPPPRSPSLPCAPHLLLCMRGMEMTSAGAASDAPCAAALGFERLPSALVLVIIGFMAPEVGPLQDVEAHPHGHDDILPALLEKTATVTVVVT